MTRIYALIAIVVGAGLVLTLSYTYGRFVGAQAERSAALQKSVEILRERSKTNEEVRTMDDAALCRQLGGVWNSGTCE